MVNELTGMQLTASIRMGRVDPPLGRVYAVAAVLREH